MRYVSMKKQHRIFAVVSSIVVFLVCIHIAFVCECQSAATPEEPEPEMHSGEQEKSTPQPRLQEQKSLPRSSSQSPAFPVTSVLSGNEKKSEFEKYVTGTHTTAISLDIRQFGYELFAKPPSTFSPTSYVPVGPDYVVGPGDSIKIDVWGKFEGNWNVVVDNDGNISLPKVGVFGVTGLSFTELKEVLRKNFSKYYTGFEMNVSMGPLRTMQVYVVGNVQRPGAYTISSLSTVINALFESGGPSKTGTMRNIQVKRNGRNVVVFDLYDFLLQGDKTKDIRLMPEDVIFIPPVGPLVGIAGNIKTPAIYELKGETRLLDLLRMTGGLTGTAFKGRVQVLRIEDHQFSTLFEGDLVDLEKNPEKNYILQDGDLTKIYTVVDTTTTVAIVGAIASPGEYGVNTGVTRVKDLISLAGGLLYHASDQAELTRVTVTQTGPKTDIFHIDLAKASAGDPQHNVSLQINDYLLVRSIPEWKLHQTVQLNGEVRYPGTYTFKQGETLSSLIERAGGFTSRAYLRGTQFVRERVREQQQRQIGEMVERLERELGGSGTAQVATASSPDDARMIQLELEQKRRFIGQLRNVAAKGRIALNVTDMAAFKGSAYDIELEQGDMISVPSDPKTVQVIGSVYNQNAFVFERGKDYGYFVNLSGGYTANADRSNAFILQANGAAIKAGGSFLGFGEQLSSGDTIVVPEQIERIPWMRNIKDITQIMYQIAVAAGVLIVVF